jgi:hypothetical protein
MGELRKMAATSKINDALNARNGPDVAAMAPLSLELGSEVRIYREKEKWTGLWKVLAMALGKVTIDLPNGATEFVATHVKPYNHHPEGIIIPSVDDNGQAKTPSANAQTEELIFPFEYPTPVAPRKRGRRRKNLAST